MVQAAKVEIAVTPILHENITLGMPLDGNGVGQFIVNLEDGQHLIRLQAKEKPVSAVTEDGKQKNIFN